MDPSHFNRQPPSFPFIINGKLNANGQLFNLQFNLNIIVLLNENSKLSGNPFVQFFQQNKDQPYNQNVYSYPKHNNEDNVKMLFERNNILLSAKQNKANPPTAFYSSNILGNMPVLVQEFLNNGIINITTGWNIIPISQFNYTGGSLEVMILGTGCTTTSDINILTLFPATFLVSPYK